MNRYLIGNTINLTARFLDSTGASVEPQSVALYIRDPNAIVTQYTPILSVNTASLSYTPTTIGFYVYEFKAVGEVTAAVQGQFEVYGGIAG